MGKRFVSWLRGSRLGTWLTSKFVTHPLEAMVAVCLAFAAVGLALAALSPWPFLQNASANFVGTSLAGLVIFGLANIAFGFTERRERERHALRIAYNILVPELLDNLSELRRIAKGLEEGSLTRNDPVFGAGQRVKAETWQVLVQSPLVAHLDPHLLWMINLSYYSSRRYVRELRESGPGAFARGHQAWKDLCDEHLPRFETAADSVDLALDALRAAQDRMGSV